MRNPDNTRHFATTTRSQQKIRFKNKQPTARQSYLTATNNLTTVSFCFTRHSAVRSARTKNTHKYNMDPPPKYDWILAWPVQSHFVCKPHHRLGFAPLNIKNFGQHAHKPSAVNYNNTYKTYFLKVRTYLFTPKITTLSIHTVVSVALLAYYHSLTLLPHNSLQIIPSIHIIHFLQQHSGYANHCARNLHFICSPSARQPPPRLVSPTYHLYGILHKKIVTWS